jgi:hypothetical protein
MRRIVWLAVIVIGVVVVREHLARRSERRAADEAARADWENEGGAPGPAKG